MRTISKAILVLSGAFILGGCVEDTVYTDDYYAGSNGYAVTGPRYHPNDMNTGYNRDYRRGNNGYSVSQRSVGSNGYAVSGQSPASGPSPSQSSQMASNGYATSNSRSVIAPPAAAYQSTNGGVSTRAVVPPAEDENNGYGVSGPGRDGNGSGGYGVSR